ncbi:trypsin-like peptidase domain-containing protein [Actinomycetospora corticicola]|uniref:Putative serine protease PepD n=1 Tax=Actinomycetospora corticicola TaxID=663602 RepID=A0A7Y9DX25_9PSEU|nr:trypsin-like peptidase domain-containing protein [Actinomycetospora corticicola]NYD37070.1 putative serine protease PepD [Actinomycetospora corticicola]
MSETPRHDGEPERAGTTGAEPDPATVERPGLGTGYGAGGVRWSDTPSGAPAEAPRSWSGAPFGGSDPAGAGGERTDYGWGRPAPTSGMTATPPGGFPADAGVGWSTPGPGRTEGGPDAGRGGVGRRSLVLVALVALVAGLVGGAVAGSLFSSRSVAQTSLGSTADGDPLPPAPAGTVEAIAATVLPSTVQIVGASGAGSGVIISADGLIMTNNHVLAAGRAGGLQALFADGSSAPVTLVGTAPSADIAVVRASGVGNLRPATLGDSTELRQGQAVVAVGSPLGLSGTVTSGIVSALRRPVAAGGSTADQSSVIDAIQTDAAINPGNSGGPLADSAGRIVGINTAIASVTGGGAGQEGGSIGLGFAIPMNHARRIATELVETGRATQAIIGVQVADRGARGATVAGVTPGSPAAGAGLQPNDLVTRVDDRVIEDADALVAAVQSTPPGQVVTLTVVSGGGAPRQVPVTLGSQVIGGR